MKFHPLPIPDSDLPDRNIVESDADVGTVSMAS
jgi:hypothetical protein